MFSYLRSGCFNFFTLVRPNTCKIIENWGRYHQKLEPGLHFLLPILQRVKAEISLKEFTKDLKGQEVITRDNINITIDGILYCKVLDPEKAIYSIHNAHTEGQILDRSFDSIRSNQSNYDDQEAGLVSVRDAQLAIEIMAKSLLRCEIGKITLDSVLHERARLNEKLLQDIKHYSDRWGMTCFRYEITNINIERSFSKFMNFEAESERHKRKLMLNANSIEITTQNNAQRERTVVINKKRAEAKATYYTISAWVNRIKVLREFLEQNKGNLELLEMKLKNDLVQSYQELATGDKNIFIRKDISNIHDVLTTVDLIPNSENKKN